MKRKLSLVFLSVCLLAAGWGGVTMKPDVAEASAVTLDNTDAEIVYLGAGWTAFSGLGTNWHEGTAKSTATLYDTMTYTHYHATRLKWLATKSYDRGQADVYVNNVYQTTVDLYAPTLTASSVVYDTGNLPPGVYTLTIIHRGTKHPFSFGYWIEIDAIEVTVADPHDSPIRVMPLGDSITHGVDTQVPGAYRNELWRILTNRGKLVDFVGVQSNGSVGLGDKDHNGNPMFRIDQIDTYVNGYMDYGRPEIVLLQIGTNDILQNYDLVNAPARLSALIDKIVAKLPSHGKLYVATITPLEDEELNELADMFNVAVKAIVSAKQGNGDPVYLADIHGAVVVPFPPYLYLHEDGIHPDATGYARMAEEWYNAIRNDATPLGTGGNAALNKTATASSSAVGYGPERAFDQWTDTLWVADGLSEPQWLKVDLGANVPVSRVQTQFLSYSSYVQYKIEYSTDNVNWFTYVDRTANVVPRALHVDYGSVTARYVRLTVTGQQSATDPVSVSEFQVITTYSLPLGDLTLEANNMFASDVLQVGNQWYLYTGGWLEPGMINDAIYLSVSENPDIDGNYTPPELVLAHGDSPMANDPSIVIDGTGVWHMLYTLGALNPDSESRDEFPFLEQIGYSASTDGKLWTPSQGDSGTAITFTDPYNIAGGDIVRAARPGLIKDGSTWKLWFDGQTDLSEPAANYLAISTGAAPTSFQIVHQYGAVNGFPEFWEPDVHKKADGTYVAVVNRGFNSIYYGTSTDGVNFTFTELLDLDDLGVGYTFVDNPALIVNDEDEVLGVVYGKSAHPSYPVDHDIGITLFDPPL